MVEKRVNVSEIIFGRDARINNCMCLDSWTPVTFVVLGNSLKIQKQQVTNIPYLTYPKNVMLNLCLYKTSNSCTIVIVGLPYSFLAAAND